MHRWIRLKLDVAYRISAYGRLNPTGIPAVDARQTVLGRLIQDVEALEFDAIRWRRTRKATIRARDQLRGEIWGAELRTITSIAAVASVHIRGIAGRFTLPPFRIGDREFAFAVRRIAVEAIREQERLLPHGLNPRVPRTMLERLEEWQALDRQAVEARLRHVGARAGVKARTHELMQEFTLLGALYRHEFRTDPARLAAWRSARRVAWPAHKP